MNGDDNKSMPVAQQVGVAFAAVCLIGTLFVAILAFCTPTGPEPKPDDNDDAPIVDPRDDERDGGSLSRIAEDDAVKFAKDIQEAYRAASRTGDRRRNLRERIPVIIHDHSFLNVMQHLKRLPYDEFSEALLDVEPGFSYAAEMLRRSRHSDTSEAVADYLESVGGIFTKAAKSAKRVSEDTLHAWLSRANTRPGQRLIDALCDGGTRQSPALGWLYNEEHREELLQSSNSLPMLTAWAKDAPVEINPRKWHRIENQGQMGSCQGHAQSSVCEMAYYIATGNITQFSPLFAYLDSQTYDKIIGADRGSTLAGGLASAVNHGACPLEVMPYPNPVRYPPNASRIITPATYRAAEPFKIKQHTVLRSYQQVKAYLASGQGGVEIGIRWPNEWMNCNGRLDNFRPGEGGHAVCFLGYDDKGWLHMANSWGEEWGDRGWALVSPRAVDQMLADSDTVMIGMSDMNRHENERREVSWIGKESVF